MNDLVFTPAGCDQIVTDLLPACLFSVIPTARLRGGFDGHQHGVVPGLAHGAFGNPSPATEILALRSLSLSALGRGPG